LVKQKKCHKYKDVKIINPYGVVMNEEGIVKWLGNNNCTFESEIRIDGNNKIRYKCNLCSKEYQFSKKYTIIKINNESYPCKSCKHGRTRYTEENVGSVLSKLNLEILNTGAIHQNQLNKLSVKCTKCYCEFTVLIRALMGEKYRGCKCNTQKIEDIKNKLKKNNLVFKDINQPKYITLGSRKDIVCIVCKSTNKRYVKDAIDEKYKCKNCYETSEKDFFLTSLEEFGFVAKNITVPLRSNSKVKIECKRHSDVSLHKTPNQIKELKKSNHKIICKECEKGKYLNNLKIRTRNNGLILHYTSIQNIESTRFSSANEYKKTKVTYTCIERGHVSETSARTLFSDGTGCNKCKQYKGEELTREIFEKYFNKQFVKQKIEINNQIFEFDGVCGDLAFEYQGELHYKYNPHFHKDLAEFKYIQIRDNYRVRFWSGNGRYLFVVKYYKKNQIKDVHDNIKASFNRVNYKYDDKKLQSVIYDILG
jgi:hypothetical protein